MRDEVSKVHVGNLLHTVTDPDLCDTFEKYGFISYVSIVEDHDTGESRGFAFIQFESESSAEDAISASSSKDGIHIKGQRCTVEMSRPRKGGPRGGYRGRDYDTPTRGTYRDRNYDTPTRGTYRDRGSYRGSSSYRGGSYNSGSGYSSGDRYASKSRYDSEDRYGGGYSNADRYGESRYSAGYGGYAGGRGRGSYNRGRDRDYDRSYAPSDSYSRSGGGGYGRRESSPPSSFRYDGYRPRVTSRY